MNQPALLPNRALLRIGGGDAEGFLQNLVTCDIEGLRPDALTLGALLTPQGKILFEFFLAREGDGFVIDIDASMRADFLKRLTFYKLRADVHLAPVDDAVAVLPGGDGSGASDRSRLGPRCFADPRHPDLGLRIWGHAEAYGAPSSAYHARRIACGVPEMMVDFQASSAFPHEVLMDQYAGAGVDFTKGCYVGQEVVSRMQHRGTARSRFVIVHAQHDLPARGTSITANDRDIGRMGSAAGGHGLALLRLDRAHSAIVGGVPILAGETPVTVTLPDFVQFSWPADVA